MDQYTLADMGAEQSQKGLLVLSGCFLFCRTQALQKVGGFDPRYFLYFEDNDLSRMVRGNATLAFEPRVIIVHYGGGASHKGLAHIRMLGVSAWKYFWKHGWAWK
jgi:hypothetical protein